MHKQPENVVQLHCSMEMTRLDVSNYLEKIYNVSPIHVRIRIGLGKTRMCPKQRCVIKDDDMKIAYVVLVSASETNRLQLNVPSITILFGIVARRPAVRVSRLVPRDGGEVHGGQIRRVQVRVQAVREVEHNAGLAYVV